MIAIQNMIENVLQNVNTSNITNMLGQNILLSEMWNGDYNDPGLRDELNMLDKTYFVSTGLHIFIFISSFVSEHIVINIQEYRLNTGFGGIYGIDIAKYRCLHPLPIQRYRCY